MGHRADMWVLLPRKQNNHIETVIGNLTRLKVEVHIRFLVLSSELFFRFGSVISSGGKIDFSRKKEKIRKTNTKGTTGHFWPLRGKGLSPFWIQITFTPNNLESPRSREYCRCPKARPMTALPTRLGVRFTTRDGNGYNPVRYH